MLLEHIDLGQIYKTQWLAHFKRGFGSPTIVYGESEAEARNNALAYYRKNKTLVDFFPIDSIVDYVTYIG